MTHKTITELIDEAIIETNSLTSEQLQQWCKSKECFDYLNR